MMGLLDTTGKIILKRKKEISDYTVEDVIETIFSESETLLKQAQNESGFNGDLCAVGVSIPGLADPERGIWVYSPFSKISDFNIREVLEKKFKCPVYIENDGNICVLGEKRFGIAKNENDFIWITVSNGIGSGLFLDGKLYPGASGNAGEIGHFKVVDNGDPCPCGGKGCLETYGAAPGIVRRYKKLAGEQKNITALEISELARGRDRNALKVFEEEGFFLGKGIAAAVNILNVPLVVIGGGVSGSFDLFEPSMKQAIRDFIFYEANKNLRVVKTALGYEASLISAGACALYGMEHSQAG